MSRIAVIITDMFEDSIVQDIKNAGAEFLDQDVVEDGRLVSSRHPGDLPAFIWASLRHLDH